MLRDENGLPWYWNGKHYLEKCMLCGFYVVDSSLIENHLCPACRRDPNEKDMECVECGKMYSRKDMYNNFICISCYKEATK